MRRLCAILMGAAQTAAALCLTLCLCAALVTGALFLRGDATDWFANPQNARQLAAEALRGANEELTDRLFALDEFSDVCVRYAEAYAKWRFDGGQPWQGLDASDTAPLARALLLSTLYEENAQHASSLAGAQQARLDALGAPLQKALAELFPPFESLQNSASARRADGIAAFLNGRAAILCAAASLVLICVLCALLAQARRAAAVVSACLFSSGVLCGVASQLLCRLDMPFFVPQRVCRMLLVLSAASVALAALLLASRTLMHARQSASGRPETTPQAANPASESASEARTTEEGTEDLNGADMPKEASGGANMPIEESDSDVNEPMEAPNGADEPEEAPNGNKPTAAPNGTDNPRETPSVAEEPAARFAQAPSDKALHAEASFDDGTFF